MGLKLKKSLLLSLLLAVLLPSTAYAVNWCDDANCMGCFLMEDDGNETDEAKGNTLTETGGDIPQDGDKKFGAYSRDFTTSDTEWLEHADGLDTDISGENQSISFVAWVKAKSSAAAAAPIMTKYDFGDANRQYLFYIAGNDQVTLILSSNGTANVTASGGTTLAVNDTTWYHVAAVYNDIDIRIYLDGVLDTNPDINPLTYSAGIYNGNQTFAMGEYYNTTPVGRHFDGLMDDTGIFDNDLDSTDINDIMDNGLFEAAAGRRRMWIE